MRECRKQSCPKRGTVEHFTPMHSDIQGPFGTARHIESVPAAVIAEMYRRKCGFDVSGHFQSRDTLDLYECNATGYRFWRPDSVAGDESFYEGLSHVWHDYYREWRWEYEHAMALLRPANRVLEIGCGRGYFLRLVQDRVARAVGLELNRDAIRAKVTRCEVIPALIEEFASGHARAFDAVCSFQVLEHVTDPASFIQNAATCVRPGGLLVFSTPNILHREFARRLDAFDLPPHHVGHFSTSVYRKIARKYGFTLRHVIEQGRFVPREAGARALVKRALNTVHRGLYGPGPYLLAVFQIP